MPMKNYVPDKARCIKVIQLKVCVLTQPSLEWHCLPILLWDSLYNAHIHQLNGFQLWIRKAHRHNAIANLATVPAA